MTRTTVSKTSYTRDNGDEITQYRTTIPKALAESLDLGGSKVEWKVEASNRLSFKKVDE